MRGCGCATHGGRARSIGGGVASRRTTAKCYSAMRPTFTTGTRSPTLKGCNHAFSSSCGPGNVPFQRRRWPGDGPRSLNYRAARSRIVRLFLLTIPFLRARHTHPMSRRASTREEFRQPPVPVTLPVGRSTVTYVPQSNLMARAPPRRSNEKLAFSIQSGPVTV